MLQNNGKETGGLNPCSLCVRVPACFWIRRASQNVRDEFCLAGLSWEAINQGKLPDWEAWSPTQCQVGGREAPCCLCRSTHTCMRIGAAVTTLSGRPDQINTFVNLIGGNKLNIWHTDQGPRPKSTPPRKRLNSLEMMGANVTTASMCKTLINQSNHTIFISLLSQTIWTLVG